MFDWSETHSNLGYMIDKKPHDEAEQLTSGRSIDKVNELLGRLGRSHIESSG